jgi:glycosyltransferase involved in cell wall biosynthesis
MFSFTVLFHRLGPYHHARLHAFSATAQEQGDNLVAVEFSAVDNTYAWETVEKKNEFRQVTLFYDTDIDKKSSNEIMSRMITVLDEMQPKIVVIPGWSHLGALAALHWCQINNIPAIVMSESTAQDAPRKWWKELIKKRIVGLFSAGLVGGSRHIDYLLSLGMPSKHIFTGYDVIDNSHFATGADSARQDAHKLRERFNLPEHYFLASNRFIQKKNIPNLLKAYALYCNKTGNQAWKLVLLGDGPLKQQVVTLIEKFNISKNVILAGFKQYAELPIYYGLAGAFVHASTVEQWGLVVNEAMAAGLPVIVSEPCGCVPDLIKEGRNGFSFNPYDIDTLAQLMLKMASLEEDERKTMGQASRDIISAWTPETFAQNLMKAIEVALNRPCPQTNWVDKTLLWALKYHR